jgi:hypothetical protein
MIASRKKGEALLVMIELMKSGYAGVLPNGNIVDRRDHPDAVPCARNGLLLTPAPLPVAKSPRPTV